MINSFILKRIMIKENKLPTVLIIILCVFVTSYSFSQDFSLEDFYGNNAVLKSKTDSVYNTLSQEQRIVQMIITSAGELGKSEAVVTNLVENNKIGGVVYLKGTKQSHQKMINKLNKIAIDKGYLPLINSMDAEPSLLNGRIKGSGKMMKTIEIKTVHQCDSIVGIIDSLLIELGIHQNYAPVCDISPDNEAIKNRSFGSDQETVIKLSNAFISSTQEDNIVATAKHFPGHGLVKGDTHKQSVYIDGKLQELDTYKPLIENGVISIMVAHITIENNEKYNTNGLPSTCSRVIVTDLLRNELNFKGIIITDAMNIMKAVTILDKAPLKASLAGCDMLLMPIDEVETIQWILDELKDNEEYSQQIEESVKRILRLKICLGLIK